MTGHDEAAAHALSQLTASFFGAQSARRPTAEEVLGADPIGALLRADLAVLAADASAPTLLDPDAAVRAQARARHDQQVRVNIAIRDRLAKEQAAADSEEAETERMMSAYYAEQEHDARMAELLADEHLSTAELQAEVEAELAAEDLMPDEQAGEDWGDGSW